MSRPFTISGEPVIRWTAQQLGKHPEEFGYAEGIGVMLDGSALICGVVFSEWRPMAGGGSMQATIAATSPRWATRNTLGRMFAYPFLQLGAHRLWVATSRKNKRARRTAERLGFKIEGVARRGWDAHTDAAVLAMLAHECKWIKGYGQEHAIAA